MYTVASSVSNIDDDMFQAAALRTVSYISCMLKSYYIYMYMCMCIYIYIYVNVNIYRNVYK